jgi:hypothetical protein
MGLNFLSVNGNHAIVVQVMSRVLISIGGGCSVMTSQLGTSPILMILVVDDQQPKHLYPTRIWPLPLPSSASGLPSEVV